MSPRTARLDLQGMSCANCAGTIEERVGDLAGVESVDANYATDEGTIEEYRQMLTDAGFSLRDIEELTQHSVGRFRKWTTLFLGLLASPARPLAVRLLRWYGLDPATIRTQVRRAHEALPHLGHVIFVATT